jgi:hypothetical protein
MVSLIGVEMAVHLSRRRHVVVLVVVAVVAASWASPGRAVPFDINPDVSTNSNPNGSTGGRVNHMAADPTTNDVFYLASEYGGLFRSGDGGSTWNHLDGHVPAIGWDVEVDPVEPARVYAASWYDGRVDSIAGINVSTDAGATWAHPATAYPLPSLEGTAEDNTPDPGYGCVNSRTEPSAFGISLEPSGAGPVVVGTRCGVAISEDAGRTWVFRDPNPATGGANVIWDAFVHPGGTTIDVCGVGGHFRSPDGGTTWVGGTGGLPSGRCSISVSPDEDYVLFVVASNNQVYESDDAGASWTSLGSNGAQGRIPFIVTNQRADVGSVNRFDVWYADTQLFRGACTTPTPPAMGGTRRCPNASTWTNNQSGAHWDGGDLLFDTEDVDGVDACPVLFSSDGGVHTRAGGTCEAPVWTRANVGYHGTWLWTMDGSDDSSSLAAEYLYYGMQDNGTMVTSDAGAMPPRWTNPRCCDTFDVLAGPTWALATTCCFTGGRSNHLQLGGLGYVGEAQVTSYPAGDIPGFTWGHRLTGFGGNRVGMITSAGVFFTDDITARPIMWSPMTAMPTGNPGTPCSIRSATDGVTTTFFVQTGQCTGRGPDRLYWMDGTNGTWNRIDDDAGIGGIGIFAADPTDPDRLYISQNPRGQGTGGAPSMQWSVDRGVSWHPDPELDDMMTAGGVFKYLTAQGPSTNRGGAGAAFQGYAQPLLLAWSAEDPGVLVAGGVDSGVFLSLDAGAHWSLVTDPVAPSVTGVAQLPRPRYAYFDTEPADGFAVYVGTQGRGVWRLVFTPPAADAGGPYVTDEGVEVVLNAAASTDDDSLTYVWDLDDDGQFDDATGVTAPFTTVGQDGSFAVHVKVTDLDGAYDVADSTVTVLDAAPTIDGIGNDGPVAEGSPVTVTATAGDRGWLDELSATIDWGDGTPVETSTEHGREPQAVTTLEVSGRHVYGDNGRFDVRICVADDDTETCASTAVVVDNTEPAMTLDEALTTSINGKPTILTSVDQPLELVARSTDPGSDDLTVTWDWDDDQPDDVAVSFVNPPNPDPAPSPSIQPRAIEVTAAHTYLAAGVHIVRSTVHDDDGGTGSAGVDVVAVGVAALNRSAGYWRHQYRQNGHTDLDPPTLQGYLDIVRSTSAVFGEISNPTTLAQAEAILDPARSNGDAARALDRQLLVVWLNHANGGIGYDEPVDTDGDAIADTPFALAVAAAEAVRLDPAATRAALLAQKDVLEAINARDGG